MDHVVLVVVPVPHGGAGGGQQVQDAVIPGADALGGESGGQGGQSGLVVRLRCHGAQGGPGVELRVVEAGASGPAVRDLPHGCPVPAGQARQSLVGEHMHRIRHCPAVRSPPDAALGPLSDDGAAMIIAQANPSVIWAASAAVRAGHVKLQSPGPGSHSGRDGRESGRDCILQSRGLSYGKSGIGGGNGGISGRAFYCGSIITLLQTLQCQDCSFHGRRPPRMAMTNPP